MVDHRFSKLVVQEIDTVTSFYDADGELCHAATTDFAIVHAGTSEVLHTGRGFIRGDRRCLDTAIKVGKRIVRGQPPPLTARNLRAI